MAIRESFLREIWDVASLALQKRANPESFLRENRIFTNSRKFSPSKVSRYTLYGHKQASRHTHNFHKCSHASVGLAQARPNYRIQNYQGRWRRYVRQTLVSCPDYFSPSGKSLVNCLYVLVRNHCDVTSAGLCIQKGSSKQQTLSQPTRAPFKR